MVADGQDAEAAGVGGGRHQPGAGHPAHAGLHDGIAHPDQLAQLRCAAPGEARASPGATSSRPGPDGGRAPGSRRQLLVPHPSGSRTSRIRSSSSSVGAGVVGARRSGTTSSKPVASTTSSTLDAGMDRAQPHGVVGRLEVEHAQVGDDPPDLVEARAPPGPAAAARS